MTPGDRDSSHPPGAAGAPGSTAGVGVAQPPRVAHEVAEVIATRRAGSHHHLTLVAPGVAEGARPGQFLSVGVGGEGSGHLTRRALAIHRTSPSGTYGGTVEIIVEPVGPGTRWITERRAHDTLDVIGPLGRGFPLPTEAVPCVLVGIAHGSASLLWLAEQLKARSCPVEIVLCADDDGHLFGAVEARRVSGGVTLVTRDGSAGRGSAAGRLHEVIQRSGASVVYAAGPLADVGELASVAAAHGVVLQAALEPSMGCGTGVCLSCVVPVRGNDEVTRMVRACIEGPVVRGDRVRWDAIEAGRVTVPADALGAAHVAGRGGARR